ncbi:NAD(P)/FAD-dependent oxidoreductase [Alphaproteobacteria bacterium LSUCC0684]
MTSSTMPRCAIIGAGLAGVTLARSLEGLARVRIFEKSRGLGGRMSTRRHDVFTFDHGAQYFTVKGEGFRKFLEPYFRDGTVRPWQTRFVRMDADGNLSDRAMTSTPWVACPGMTGLVKAMASRLDCRHEITISRIRKKGGLWQLLDAEGMVQGEAEWVITAIPARQASGLLPEEFQGRSALEQVRMLGCFSLMLGFETPLPLDFGACFVEDQPVGFMAENGTKPGGEPMGSLTVQARNAWAEDMLEAPEEAAAIMAEWLKERVDIRVKDAACKRFHRWRYASVDTPLGAAFLLDEDLGLGAIGDWCIRGRVESAYDSAAALGARMKEMLD